MSQEPSASDSYCVESSPLSAQVSRAVAEPGADPAAPIPYGTGQALLEALLGVFRMYPQEQKLFPTRACEPSFKNQTWPFA